MRLLDDLYVETRIGGLLSSLWLLGHRPRNRPSMPTTLPATPAPPEP